MIDQSKKNQNDDDLVLKESHLCLKASHLPTKSYSNESNLLHSHLKPQTHNYKEKILEIQSKPSSNHTTQVHEQKLIQQILNHIQKKKKKK